MHYNILFFQILSGFKKELIVVKAVECEDFTHKCEIECPLCRMKIKGNYGSYKSEKGTAKAAAWYTNFPRHCTDVHVNLKNPKMSRKRSADVSQTKISEIFQRKEKSNIDGHFEESVDEIIELEEDSDDEPLFKKKKSKPIPENSGEQLAGM